jgi:hypothetical protein
LRASRFGSDLHGGLWDREIRAQGRAVHQPFEEIRLNVMSYEGDVIQYYTILDAQHVIINRQVLAFGDWIKFRQVTCTYHSIKVNRTEPSLRICMSWAVVELYKIISNSPWTESDCPVSRVANLRKIKVPHSQQPRNGTSWL